MGNYAMRHSRSYRTGVHSGPHEPQPLYSLSVQNALRFKTLGRSVECWVDSRSLDYRNSSWLAVLGHTSRGWRALVPHARAPIPYIFVVRCNVSGARWTAHMLG